MDEPEKREIEEELKMIYKIDQFIDGNPRVEERIERAVAQRVAQGDAQSVAQSIAQGDIQSLQRLAISAIKRRFPALLAQAQIQNTDVLDELILQLASATTEDGARRVLQIQENQ